MNRTPPAADPTAKNGILKFLKQAGPSDAVTIARRFAVSGMAIRQHLYTMQKSGLITYKEHRRPLGRPAKLWQLTDRAQQFFPDAHAELAVNLLQILGETFGPVGINKMLAARTAKQIEAYRREIPAKSPLRTRLDLLCAIREREGYMAKVETQKDGTYLFIENHCPICSAAKSCTGFCGGELQVFQAVLGKNCTVERTEHLLSGARRCAYRVSD